jgi:hypothetical protein
VPRDVRLDDPAHRLLAYRVEPQLIEAVGNFVADALAAGGAAAVLATPRRLNAVDEWVRLRGSDIDAAISERRYHRADLNAVLRHCDPADDPAGAFEAWVHEILVQIPADVAPIHIFDGAVATLWGRGDIAAILRVETVCSELCAARGVSLLCAYPESELVSLPDVQNAWRQHTAVLAAPPFPGPTHSMARAIVSSVVLPPAPAACGSARHLVKSTLADDNGANSAYAAELVVSELSANAVCHAGSTFEVEVSLFDGVVRLAVTDSTPAPNGWTGFPVATEHGLGIVAALANDWGVETLDGGKIVWAEVAR